MESASPEGLCQSCGMPMAATEHFGTYSDSSPCGDYCCFCFREGAFTDDFDLEGKIIESLSYLDGSEKTGGRRITREEHELHLRVLMPRLKRWRAHERHNEYYAAVNRAVGFINDHLTSRIDLLRIARHAGISEFHFHRIFKAVLGESPGEYVQRLRLEEAAFRLETTRDPVSDIALNSGYGSPHSFTKAFGRYFGISPSAYRKYPVERIPSSASVPKLELNVRITRVKDIKAICLRVEKPFSDPDAYRKAWRTLTTFAGTDGVPDEYNRYISISQDISTITRQEHYRTYVCISRADGITPRGRFGSMTIQGGLYAVFTHRGPYSELQTVYCNIYRNWIPASGYELRDKVFFENYLNTPDSSDRNELLTEIYIPVRKKKDYHG